MEPISTDTKETQQLTHWILLSLIALSFIGFLDATYLTAKHFQGVPPTCTLLKGCDVVTTSQYATMFGIPVALFGTIFYLSVFLLAVLYADKKYDVILHILPPLTLVGFLASLWFLFVQIFLLQALCLYCLGSATSSTLLFILGIIIFRMSTQRG